VTGEYVTDSVKQSNDFNLLKNLLSEKIYPTLFVFRLYTVFGYQIPTNIFKIGFTWKSHQERISELNNALQISSLKLEYIQHYSTFASYKVEAYIKKALFHKRLSYQEFFARFKDIKLEKENDSLSGKTEFYEFDDNEIQLLLDIISEACTLLS